MATGTDSRENAEAKVMSRACMLVVAGIVACAGGCSDNSRAVEQAPPPPSPPPLKVPVEMTVAQRTITPVPNSNLALLLTIDDITGGQVMASLSAEGVEICPRVSLAEGESAPFRLGDHEYVLVLNNLDNSLMGEDYATFIIDKAAEPASAAAPLSEKEKIELLILAVAQLKNAVFIRNGSEHTLADAVDHMRMKWKAAGEQITTARQFIEGAASKSSVSGEPYEIRFADGRTVTAGEFFRTELERIEGSADAR